jgi:hypothetical protein
MLYRMKENVNNAVCRKMTHHFTGSMLVVSDIFIMYFKGRNFSRFAIDGEIIF